MRPVVHFSSTGWINDPHGITWDGTRYHVFFQAVPHSTAWDLGCRWGHAVGPDLLTLTDIVPALAPGEGDDGIWSGSLAFDATGTPRIHYTAVHRDDLARGVVRSATPVDADWVEWRKGEVELAAPTELGVRVFRDPFVFRDAGGWAMVVGAGFDDGAAGLIGATSPDGIVWGEPVVAARWSPLPDGPVTGSMWECPQLVRVDGRDVLVVSSWHDDTLYDVVFALGEREGVLFRPARWGRLGYGPSVYAATAFTDAEGSPCLLFWLRDVAGDGWSGVHSLPYRLHADDEGLWVAPHPDVDRHRTTRRTDAAWEVRWDPAALPAWEPTVAAGSRLTFEAVSADTVRVGVDGALTDLPVRGEVRVVVDGPVLEVCTGRAVFACAITPVVDPRVTRSPVGRAAPDGLVVAGLAREV